MITFMNNLGFEYPYLLALIPLLWWCVLTCKEKLQWRYFVHLHLFEPAKPWIRREWLLKLLILSLLVVAVASPVRFDSRSPSERSGIDIVLSLDGSGSMNASGFDEENPRATRFEVVQQIAQAFILKRFGDNVGVVLFGDYAFIASPVTYEKEIVSEMISYLSHGMAGNNTAIGEGLFMALRALERSKAKNRVVILLTDGEHNSGRIAPKEAVELAKERGVKLYTIGIGKEGEFDSALLQMIADEGGGAYFSATNKEALLEVYAQIDTLEPSPIKSRGYLVKEFYFAYPLLAALALLWLLLHQRRSA